MANSVSIGLQIWVYSRIAGSGLSSESQRFASIPTRSTALQGGRRPWTTVRSLDRPGFRTIAAWTQQTLAPKLVHKY
ncbi:hypothetical protein [Nodosilinea nodulosa]|uniref:hypothetical protein n=1 Tax=Nodosilinea nodulosa TaxID=416001 RepID=UPI0012D82DA2|nr:hypothetical protein [Nodosilinea nodulosa]